LGIGTIARKRRRIKTGATIPMNPIRDLP